MNKIVPHLWFDKEAKEASAFYIGLFPNSRITRTGLLHDTPSGDVDTIEFELAGQPFSAMSAGPYFRFNPSISLFVACATAGEVDALWKALSDGGTELMPLGEYPFSSRFGWVQDRYGLTWQLLLTDGEQPPQKITPHLLFSGAAKGHAAEAVRFYTEVFRTSGLDTERDSGAQNVHSAVTDAGVLHFNLLGQSFSAMNHGYDADFTFNEAISLIVRCDTQKQIDYLWDKLSHVPEAEACGWLKDKFGISWQIVPSLMDKMMESGTEEQLERVTRAFLQMKKFDIAALQRAYDGK